MNSDMSGEDKAHLEVEEEIEDLSGGENQPKRKRYHRHSSQQIQAMEGFFRDCPHPDKKQRSELGQDLGMEPLQVKFWFQNKRTQMKSKHQHQENARLMAENEKLRALNMRYNEALNNACCPICGRIAAVGDELRDEQHLRMENSRLRDEIDRISAIASNYVGRPLTNSAGTPSTALGSGPFFKGSTSKAARRGSSEDEDF